MKTNSLLGRKEMRVLIIMMNVMVVAGMLILESCGAYSFTGTSTPAKTISFTEFYNNADLGPANMGQTFTNSLKNYIIQNSSLKVIPEEAELQLSGEITDFRLNPIAPTSTGDQNDLNTAALTRLTIVVKVTFVNTIDESMSFKDKSFSFYQDFDNDAGNFGDLEEGLTRRIFDQLEMDIYNASIANW